jgi:ppGpp synthetase/RelA/SpoT-type nucleotidyltranferase
VLSGADNLDRLIRREISRHYAELNDWRVSSEGAQDIGESLLREAADQLFTTLGYRLFVMGRHPKEWKRIIEKLERFMKAAAADTTATGLIEEALSNLYQTAALRAQRDLAGGRIIIPFIDKLIFIHQQLVSYLETIPNVQLDGEMQNYLEKPKQGYRALHQGLLVELGTRVSFPFEIQFMTFLQLDWATKAHPVHEHETIFSGNADAHQRLSELSEDLFELDTRGNQLFYDLQRIIENDIGHDMP